MKETRLARTSARSQTVPAAGIVRDAGPCPAVARTLLAIFARRAALILEIPALREQLASSDATALDLVSARPSRSYASPCAAGGRAGRSRVAFSSSLALESAGLPFRGLDSGVSAPRVTSAANGRC